LSSSSASLLKQSTGLESLERCLLFRFSLMLAHGFEIEILGQLALDGLAVAVGHTTIAGRRRIKVSWLRISAAGRKAIAEQA
jgi:hypothetical protein